MASVTVTHDRAWFISDTHFWHRKAAEIRGFGYGEYLGIMDMNDAIVHNWNASVGKNDDVFLLGDVSFAGSAKTLSILERLNGRIHLVRGNHDKGLNLGASWVWYSENDLLTVKVQMPDDSIQRIVCCHFPMLVWDMQHYGAWHLHGHSHGKCRYPTPRAKMFDVGVDTDHLGRGPLRPYSFADIGRLMTSIPEVVSHDYHRVRESDDGARD